jgi:hypothetical protein
MRQVILNLLIAAATVSACQASTATQSKVEGQYASLPLTEDNRARLMELISGISNPEILSSCTNDEIELMRVVMALVAVESSLEGMNDSLTDDEMKHVAELMEKWENMGGDDGSVSVGCESAAEKVLRR